MAEKEKDITKENDPLCKNRCRGNITENEKKDMTYDKELQYFFHCWDGIRITNLLMISN